VDKWRFSLILSETAESIWTGVLERLKPQFKEEIYNLWIKPLRPAAWGDALLTVQVPNRYFADWVQKNAQTAIETSLREILGRDGSVSFETSENQEVEPDSLPETPAAAPVIPSRIENHVSDETFNPKYTFDTFVVGPSNRFAQAAAAAVAKDPGKTYNPLFLYGGVGLGKTHILHAIAHGIRANNPGARVLYVTSERFINEFIDAIRFERMKEFRAKYRGLDCLLIDDIQFLMGKASLHTKKL
jgi:chromosomal replication initiator protein